MSETHFTETYTGEPPRAPTPIRGLDLALGSILLACSMVGVPANCAACYHFINQATKNKNSTFFKRIYTIISVIDVMIGLAQIPIAQTLITGRDSPDLLYRSSSFCYFWYIIWLILKQGAVFMVAFMSIARLTILITTRKVMRLRNAWLIPAVFISFVLAVLGILPLSTRYAAVLYAQDNAMCRITVEDPEQSEALALTSAPRSEHTVALTQAMSNKTEPDYRPYFMHSFIVTITEACFFGLPVFPIFISFVLSLKFLKKADQRSLRITSTASQFHEKRFLPRQDTRIYVPGEQRSPSLRSLSQTNKMASPLPRFRRANRPVTRHLEASITIMMVTLTYVIFNLPALATTVYLAYIYCRCLALIYSRQYEAYLLWEYAKTVYTNFGPAWPYIWLLVYGVFPVFNSTVNPLLYWWRMEHFRAFLDDGRRRFSQSTRILRTWSGTYLSFTTVFEKRSRSTTHYQPVDGARI